MPHKSRAHSPLFLVIYTKALTIRDKLKFFSSDLQYTHIIITF